MSTGQFVFETGKGPVTITKTSITFDKADAAAGEVVMNIKVTLKPFQIATQDNTPITCKQGVLFSPLKEQWGKLSVPSIHFDPDDPTNPANLKINLALDSAKVLTNGVKVEHGITLK